MDDVTARKQIEEMWSDISQSERVRLWNCLFHERPVPAPGKTIKFRGGKNGPGDDSSKKVTMAVAAGRKVA